MTPTVPTGRSAAAHPAPPKAGQTMRRVVITGLGVVAPGGVGVKEYWDLLTAGRDHLARLLNDSA